MGVARFTPDGPGAADYAEQGTLRWPTHEGPAHRRLRCVSAGERAVDFSFPDGRPFHRLELRPDGFDAAHPCGADRYAGHFQAVGDDEWHATWDVEGPRKRFLLEGTYRRLRPAGPAPR